MEKEYVTKPTGQSGIGQSGVCGQIGCRVVSGVAANYNYLPAASASFPLTSTPSMETHIWKLPPTCQPMLSSCKRDDVTRRCFQVCCRSRRGQIARRGSGCVMSGHSTDTLVGRAESEQQSGGESRGLTGATASSLPGATQSPPLSFSTTNYLTSIIDRSYVRGRPTFIYTDRWGPSSSYSTIV